MPSPSSRESLQALPDWSAVPSNSEEDRRLVGQRIAFFGAVVGVISAGFYVFVQLLGVATNPYWREQIVHPASMMHLAAAAVFGLMWFSCRKGQRSSRELNVINVGGLVASSVFYSLMVGLAPRSAFAQNLVLALIVVTTISTHAIIVPATQRRTLWASTLAVLPVPLTAYVVASRNEPSTTAGVPWAAFAEASFVTLWCATGVTTSTLASRIIYGLQQRVRAATELGQYTLEEKIGEGGMGAVYRARHALLRRPTAIKLLTGGRGDERQIRRFEREVQLTASLTHPNTIAVYDFGRTPDGVFYYAMEYLEGITLEELVEQDGPQAAGRVVHILEQVCAALVEAHQLGLVHRDIKPANIMLSIRGCVPDHVKVLDFGLVKEIADRNTRTTGQNTLLGTPLYLAPEAITNPDAVGPAADLYAVGAVAYQLLSGRPPFEGQTVVEVCSKHLLAEPSPLSASLADRVPPALDALILACLAKDPAARPESAGDLVERLAALELTPQWSAVSARQWWESRGAVVIEAALRERRQTRAGSPATIAIDLAARSMVEPASGAVANPARSLDPRPRA